MKQDRDSRNRWGDRLLVAFLLFPSTTAMALFQHLPLWAYAILGGMFLLGVRYFLKVLDRREAGAIDDQSEADGSRGSR